MAENGGIVGRGVLLDYAEWAGRNNVELKPIESVGIKLDHLKAIVEEQKIEFRPADILFIRSGFTVAYDKLSPKEQEAVPQRPEPAFAGVEATKDVLRWIWEHQFAAVAGDMPGFERSPIAGPHADPDVMLHQWLLAGWGMPIGEMFDLEKLGQYCKKTGRHSFFVSSVPLKVRTSNAEREIVALMSVLTAVRCRVAWQVLRTEWQSFEVTAACFVLGKSQYHGRWRSQEAQKTFTRFLCLCVGSRHDMNYVCSISKKLVFCLLKTVLDAIELVRLAPVTTVQVQLRIFHNALMKLALA